MSTITRSENRTGGLREAELTRLDPEPGLSVFVVFTSIDRTLRALEKAREMARLSGAKIAVIALQIVPYPLPIFEPPVGFEFVVRRFAEKAGRSQEKIQVSAYLCRDPFEALKVILNPDYPVVMGIKKKWWPTRDERLARRLRRAGYDVISVETE